MSEAQQQGREGLERTADALSDGIAVCQAGRIVWANRRMTDLSGRAATTLLGASPESLLPPDAPAFDDELETTLTRPDGRSAPVRVLRIAGAAESDSTWIFRDVGRSGELERAV